MRVSSSAWRDPAAWSRAAWVAAIPGALLFGYLQVRGYAHAEMVGVDSHAYWAAARSLALSYDVPVSVRDAYLYSPLFAQLLWPLAQLPWPVFQLTWLLLQLVVAGWLVRPLGWWRGVILLFFVAGEFVLENVYIFLAALLVLAVRGSGLSLASLLLIKPTHGVVALWHLCRGMWRVAAVALLVLAAVVGVSFLLDPSAWAAWIRLLLESSQSTRASTLPLRLLVALLLVLVSARTNRSVVLAPAMILATPVLDGLTYLALLLSMPRLLTRDRGAKAEAGEEDPLRQLS